MLARPNDPEQTQAVLRQAYSEKVQPVLVLNKMDRLIMELHLTPDEAYQRLRRVLEEVNAIAGRLWKEHYVKSIIESSEAEDWVLEEEDDADVYFSPERGNVVFASATEGWGFRLHHFADLYQKKLGAASRNRSRPELIILTLNCRYQQETAPEVLVGRALHQHKVETYLYLR